MTALLARRVARRVVGRLRRLDGLMALGDQLRKRRIGTQRVLVQPIQRHDHRPCPVAVDDSKHDQLMHLCRGQAEIDRNQTSWGFFAHAVMIADGSIQCQYEFCLTY